MLHFCGGWHLIVPSGLEMFFVFPEISSCTSISTHVLILIQTFADLAIDMGSNGFYIAFCMRLLLRSLLLLLFDFCMMKWLSRSDWWLSVILLLIHVFELLNYIRLRGASSRNRCPWQVWSIPTCRLFHELCINMLIVIIVLESILVVIWL